MDWWQKLDNKRGSQPRCVLLVDGDKDKVADRLTRLVNIPEVVVSSGDKWLPYGKPVQQENGKWDKEPAKEARVNELTKLLPLDLQQKSKEELLTWWLVARRGANTPNWDIVSSCTIKGKPGLLLVEAKAHAEELSEAGKSLPKTQNGWKNHDQIGLAIAEATAGLQVSTESPWNLSRDHHYQLSNRFAWAWKLATLKIPVVLLYLGFLNAQDMAGGGLFRSDGDWENVVKDYGKGIVDNTCWGEWLDISGTPLLSLIRAYDQPFYP